MQFLYSIDPLQKVVFYKELPTDLWAETACDLVRRNEFEGGKMAFFQFRLSDHTTTKVELDLRRCNINILDKNVWLIDMIFMLLKAGSDHKSLSIQPGDRYLHAVVKMTLLCGQYHQYLLKCINTPINNRYLYTKHTKTKIPKKLTQHLTLNNLSRFIC